MLEPIPLSHDIYPHIRIIMGMVIGLGITRLLVGVARVVQHPARQRPSPVHLAWVAAVLLYLVHFWWWEFGLYHVHTWNFATYLFLIGYAIALFLLCALLFPDELHDYADQATFFYARRKWFFGVLATTYLLDIVDTLLKGSAHLHTFTTEYLIRTPVLVVLCMIAICTPSRRFHAAFVTAFLLYQISWALRLSYTLGD